MNENNPKLGEAAAKVKNDLGELGAALTRSREDIVGPVAQFMNEKPLAAVGIALGIGYVLGGGLFTKTTGRLIKVGTRLGGVALLREFLGGLADQI